MKIFGNKIETLLDPQTSNGGPDSSYLDLEDIHEAYIVCNVVQGSATAETLTLQETGAEALTEDTEIWVAEDLDDAAPVRVDDAKLFETNNDIKSKQVIFRINPARLTSGRKTVRVNVSDGEADCFVSIVAICEVRK